MMNKDAHWLNTNNSANFLFLNFVSLDQFMIYWAESKVTMLWALVSDIMDLSLTKFNKLFS